ncbi:MAG: serine/threonine-protein kinase [bacterium]
MSLSSNRYQVLKVLHEGGTGTVFKVLDKMLKMDVAIKMLNSDISRNPEALAQLKSEAAMAMKLSHENIVRLHNIESEKGRIFIVMEYVDGKTLREISEQMGALSLAAVLDIACACNSALTHAHSRGVLHRDIKPENIMINTAMALKLLDFGIAIKLTHGHDKNDFIEGSPGYMSPEQFYGRPLDVRTDVFSFAAVMAELLTAKRTFPHVSDLKHMYDSGPEGLDGLPPPLADVLQKGLAMDVQARYHSVAEFYGALEAVIRLLMT